MIGLSMMLACSPMRPVDGERPFDDAHKQALGDTLDGFPGASLWGEGWHAGLEPLPTTGKVTVWHEGLPRILRGFALQYDQRYRGDAYPMTWLVAFESSPSQLERMLVIFAADLAEEGEAPLGSVSPYIGDSWSLDFDRADDLRSSVDGVFELHTAVFDEEATPVPCHSPLQASFDCAQRTGVVDGWATVSMDPPTDLQLAFDVPALRIESRPRTP